MSSGQNLRLKFGEEAFAACSAEGLTSVADPTRCLCHSVCPVDNKQLLEQYLEHTSRARVQAEKDTKLGVDSVTEPFDVTIVSGALSSPQALECFVDPETSTVTTTTTETTSVTTPGTTSPKPNTTTTPSIETALARRLAQVLSATWAHDALVQIDDLRLTEVGHFCMFDSTHTFLSKTAFQRFVSQVS